MLWKPDLNKADIKKIKTVSAELLGELRAYLETVQDAFVKQSTSNGFRQKIYDFLYDDNVGLPTNSYDTNDISILSNSIFHCCRADADRQFKSVGWIVGQLLK